MKSGTDSTSPITEIWLGFLLILLFLSLGVMFWQLKICPYRSPQLKTEILTPRVFCVAVPHSTSAVKVY